MPGYIIHLCAAKELLKLLMDHDLLTTEKEQNEFFVSSLIPDAVKDKAISHYRHTNDPMIKVRYPLPWRFAERYPHLMHTPQGIGYLFHLYTDYLFYHEYFYRHILFTDENDGLQVSEDKIRLAYLVDYDRTIPSSDLFSDGYLYDDYTTFHGMLEEIYGFDHDLKPADNPGFKEVDYNNLSQIIRDLELYSELGKSFKYRETTVLKKEPLLAFIKQTAPRFLFDYPFVLEDHS